MTDIRGPLWVPGGGSDWQSQVHRMAAQTTNPMLAAVEAVQGSMYSPAAVENRKQMRAMNNRRNKDGYRIASNMQIAMPKIRQPMGTLGDQGVPFNVDDEEGVTVPASVQAQAVEEVLSLYNLLRHFEVDASGEFITALFAWKAGK